MLLIFIPFLTTTLSLLIYVAPTSFLMYPVFPYHSCKLATLWWYDGLTKIWIKKHRLSKLSSIPLLRCEEIPTIERKGLRNEPSNTNFYLYFIPKSALIKLKFLQQVRFSKNNLAAIWSIITSHAFTSGLTCDGLMVMTTACHAAVRGSIPGVWSPRH